MLPTSEEHPWGYGSAIEKLWFLRKNHLMVGKRL